MDRAILLANHIIETKDTVRATAVVFGISKSTVHKEVTVHLKYLDLDLAEKVRVVLDFNLAERHIRGGLATKKKWESL